MTNKKRSGILRRRILLCSVVFSENEPFLQDFFESVRNQNTKDFDFLIINENLDLSKYENLPANSKIIQANGIPAENRIQSIEYAKKNGYDYILWQDSDDICPEFRISTILAELDDVDMLIHDMSIVDVSGNKVEEHFIGDRFSYKSITIDDLLYLNFIGFGNMVVKVKCFPKNIIVPESIKAVDWWIASELLLKGINTKYISKPLYYYRQYGGNIASIDFTTVEMFKIQLQVLRMHYTNLLSGSSEHRVHTFKLQRNLKKIVLIQEAINDKNMLQQLNGFLLKNRNEKYLWWEKANRIIKELNLNG